MKPEAISTIELPHIILELDKRNKWKGVRMGATIELVRFRSRDDANLSHRIYYSVTVAGDLVVSARADTVGQAVDDINQIIHGYAVGIWARPGAQCARGAV
jgi:hypothetical protein